MTASERLREAIKLSGASLGSLARQSGCDPGNLSKFMAGKSGLGLDVGVQLAAVLGFDIRGHYPGDFSGCEPSPMGEAEIVSDVDRGPWEIVQEIRQLRSEESTEIVPTKRPRVVNAVRPPPPAKRALSPAEIRKRKNLGMPID